MEEAKKFVNVHIELPHAPATMGARILLDGVEAKDVVAAVLTMKVGGVAHLKLTHVVDPEINVTVAEVERVVVCAQCRSEMERAVSPGSGAIVETTGLSDKWRRRVPVVVKDIPKEQADAAKL